MNFKLSSYSIIKKCICFISAVVLVLSLIPGGLKAKAYADSTPKFINLSFDVSDLGPESKIPGELSYEINKVAPSLDYYESRDWGRCKSFTDTHTACIDFERSYYNVVSSEGVIYYFIVELDPITGEEIAIWENNIKPISNLNGVASFKKWQLNHQSVPTTDKNLLFSPGGTYNFTASFLDDDQYCFAEVDLDGGYILSDIDECPDSYVRIEDDLYYSVLQKDQ